MKPVNSKRDFVRRYQANEFGNRAPTWDTLAEYLDSGYKGLVHIRNRVAGGPTWYDVPAAKVAEEWDKIVKGCRGESQNPETLYLSGMAPTERTQLQGELTLNDSLGLTFYYSRCALTMREALKKESHHIFRLEALQLMRSFMDPSSYDWVQELLDLYPGHVIEFSCYGVPWGTIPHRNTVIWEVRNY